MLLLFALATAAIEWVGEAKKIRWLILFSRPTVFILLIAWIFQHIHLTQIISISENQRILWFIFGLIFFLVSDILCVLPTKFVSPRLTAPLIGQVLFVIGFQPFNPLGKNLIPGLVMFFLTSLVSLRVIRQILNSETLKNQNDLKVLGLLSTVSISFMLYSSVYTLLDSSWNYQSSFLVSIGAVAYYFSGHINAWEIFVGNISSGKFKQMMSYHIGLILLIAGVVFHFKEV